MMTTSNCVESSQKKKYQGTSSPSSTVSTASSSSTMSSSTTTPVVNKRRHAAVRPPPAPSTTTATTTNTPSTPCPSTKRLGLISKLKKKINNTNTNTHTSVPPSVPRDDNNNDDNNSEDISESIQSYLGDCPFGKQGPPPPYDPDFDGDHDDQEEEEEEKEDDVDELELDDVFGGDDGQTTFSRASSSQDMPNGEFTSSFSGLGVRRIRDSASLVAANNHKKTQIDLDNSVHIAARGGVPLRSQDANIIKTKAASSGKDTKAKKKEIRHVHMDVTSSSLDSSPTSDDMGCHDSFAVDDDDVAADAAATAPPSPSTPTRSDGLVRQSSAPLPPTRGLVRKSSMKKMNSQRRASIQVTREFKIYLPMKDTPVMKRRSISFDKNVVIRPIAPATELADKPEELWIQSEELKRMHQISMELIERRFAAEEAEYAKAAAEEEEEEEEAAEGYDYGNDDECVANTATETAATMATSYYEDYDNDDDLDSSETCIRGLEALMEADLKMERKYDAWDSVLNEQEMQRVHGEFDDLNIADAYRYSTAECSLEAHERAKQDEDEVRLYLRGVDEELGRQS